MGIKSDYNNILIVELFPHCNFNCDFCFQNSDGRTDYFKDNRILHRKSKIYYLNLFLEKFKKYDLKDIDYACLWGGELFFDKTPEYNDLLLNVIKTINPLQKLGGTTNLSCIDNPALQSLLFDKYPFTLEMSASYDAVGRFKSKEAVETYLKNLEILKSSPNICNGIIEVETVVTAEMLDDKYDFTIFNELYKDPHIINCMLLDMRGYPDYILKNFNERFLNFLKKYPKVDISRNLLTFTGCLNDKELSIPDSTPFRWCYCFRENTTYLGYVTEFEKTNNACSSCKRDDYKRVEEAFKCDECKYKNICSDICPGTVIHSKIIELNGCPYKYVYDNISELRHAYMKTMDKEELKEMFLNKYSI